MPGTSAESPVKLNSNHPTRHSLVTGIMGDGVLGIYVGGHAVVFQKIGGTVFLGPLAFVEPQCGFPCL